MPSKELGLLKDIIDNDKISLEEQLNAIKSLDTLREDEDRKNAREYLELLYAKKQLTEQMGDSLQSDGYQDRTVMLKVSYPNAVGELQGNLFETRIYSESAMNDVIADLYQKESHRTIEKVIKALGKRKS